MRDCMASVGGGSRMAASGDLSLRWPLLLWAPCMCSIVCVTNFVACTASRCHCSMCMWTPSVGAANSIVADATRTIASGMAALVAARTRRSLSVAVLMGPMPNRVALTK